MGSVFKDPKKPEPINVGNVTSAANAQNVANASANVDLNRINQTGPFGSVSYGADGSQTTSLDPAELAQREFQRTQGNQGYAAGIGGLASLAGSGPAGVGSDPYGLMAAGASRLGAFGTPADLSSNDAFDRAQTMWSANMEPRFGRAEDAARNRLANQGLDPTSEAYKSSMNDLALQQNEARNSFAIGAQNNLFNQGLAERQQGYNEGAGLMGLGSAEAQRLFGQNLSQYGAQQGALASLGGLGLSGMVPGATAPGVSSFNPVTQDNVNVAQLYGQNNENQWRGYQSDVQRQQALYGALASLAGTATKAATGGMG